MNSEKNALGRVLLVSKRAYSALSKGEPEMNVPALLDNLSAALSHLNDKKQPLNKILPKLKKEIRVISAEFYAAVDEYFSKLYPVLDYDFEKATAHVPAIIHGNDKICAMFVSGERDKMCAMCEAMKSYPGFLFGEFEALSDKQFYDVVFGFYPKLYERDDFMGEMRYLFASDKRPAKSK